MADKQHLRRLAPSGHLSSAQQRPPSGVRPVVIPGLALGSRRAASRRIVVAVDRTPRAVDAIRWAADEARLRHLQVHVVANRLDLAHVPAWASGFDHSAAGVRERARAVLDDILLRALGPASDVSLRIVISEAPLSVAVSAASRGAELVVVPVAPHGWRGRLRRRALLRGTDGCPLVAVASPVPVPASAPTAPPLRLLPGVLADEPTAPAVDHHVG